MKAPVVTKSPQLFAPSTLVMLFAAGMSLQGCSVLHASSAATTDFLEHRDELRAMSERSPWDAVWSSNPGHMMVRLDTVRRLYVAPVNRDFLNLKRNDSGKMIKNEDVDSDDVAAMSDILRQSFVDAATETPKANLQIVDSKDKADLVLELALVELIPTKVLINATLDVGEVFVPGSQLVVGAVDVTGQAVGGTIASGSIAIEGKFTDNATNTVVAEFKDREADRMTVIPNYRDFEEYGWSRKTCREWGAQFAETFSTSADYTVSGASDVSILPW